jgi:hypothetical protein
VSRVVSFSRGHLSVRLLLLQGLQSLQSGHPLEGFARRLIGTIERGAGFGERRHQRRPRLDPGLVQLLQFFFCGGGIGLHALQRGVDFGAALGGEFPGVRGELVGGFAPGVELGGSLALEDCLVLPDLLAKTLDIFGDLSLERLPVGLQFCLRRSRPLRWPRHSS